MMDENNKKVVAIVLIALLFAVMAYSNPQSINNFFNTSYFNTTGGGVSFNGSAVDGNGSSLYNFTNLAGTFNHSNLTNLNWYSSGHTGLTLNETIKTVGVGKDYTTIQSCYNSIPPVLFGNITCLIDSGTYSGGLSIGGKTTSGNYWIKFKAATTTTLLSTSATGGISGTDSIQAIITRAAAGWTVNAYRGKWVNFTSGNLINQVRLINNNSATDITTLGAYYDFVPVNNDNFIIFEPNVIILGTLNIQPTTIKVYFERVKIENIRTRIVSSTVEFIESEINIGDGGVGQVDYIYENSNVRYMRTFIKYNGLWVGLQIFGGLWNPCQSYFYGNWNIDFGAIVIGNYAKFQKGNVVENFGKNGMWSSIGGSVEFHVGEDGVGDDTIGGNGKYTYNFIKNNVLGLEANYGGHIMVTYAIYSGNTLDSQANAASYSWIG